MAFTFDYDESVLGKNLEAFPKKIDVLILMYSETKARELQATMKKKRPWTDRTGMAKALLNAKVSKPEKTLYRITLMHGVEYGIWLELANEKNYAIIGPTINQEGPRFVSDLSNLMSKLKL